MAMGCVWSRMEERLAGYGSLTGEVVRGHQTPSESRFGEQATHGAAENSRQFSMTDDPCRPPITLTRHAPGSWQALRSSPVDHNLP